MATVIEIDFGNTLSDIDRLKQSIAQLKKERQDLAKAVDEGRISEEQAAKAMTVLESGIRVQNKELQTLNRTLDNSIKQRSAEVGSIEANRAELSRLTAEYIKLGKPTQAQTDRIKELSEKLKEQEKAIGNTSRNVGNYQKAIEKAVGNLNIFGVNIGSTITGLKSTQQSLQGVVKGLGATSGALNVLKTALISTGIGAIVIALGSMIVFLTKTQKGIEIVNKVTAALSATFSVLIDRVSQIGEGLFEIFVEGKLLSGINKVATSLDGVTEEIKEEAKAASDLAATTDELAKRQVELTEVQAERRRQSEELRLAAKDEEKSIKERQDLLLRSLALEQQIAADEIAIAEERARIITDQTNLAKSTTEELQEAANARAEADEIAAGAARRQKEIQAELNGLIKKSLADEKKAIEENRKLTEQRNKEIEEQTKGRLTRQLQESEAYFAEQRLIEKENFAEGVIDKEEYNERLKELKQDELQGQIEILETFGLEVAEKQIELDNLVADNKIAIREKDLENQEEIAERVKELNAELIEAEQDLQDAKIDIASNAFDILEGFAEQGSALGRLAFLGQQAAAISETIISAQRAIAQITAQTNAIPAVLPPAIPNPAYPIAQALGLKQKIQIGVQAGIAVAKIAAQSIKGFAEGGEVAEVGGKPHSEGGTKYFGQDGNVVEMERGEGLYVMKKSAQEHIKRLSQYNEMFGGKSWMGAPVKHAQTGGVIDGGFSARDISRGVNEQINSSDLVSDLLRNLPSPEVKVTEINRKQRSLTQTVEVSEL